MLRHPFEAVVIGSGATGGVAALTLAQIGLRVLVIEAGPELTSKEALGSEPQNTFKRINRIICGEVKVQAQHPGYWKNNPSLYINEKDNQYITPKNNEFIWTQGRQVGGRSLTWGGITLRLSESDFCSAKIDNFGPEWPINYMDLEKHYSYLEKLLKVHGNRDGLEQLPDGHYLKSLPFTASEQIFKNNLTKSLNYPMIHSRGFGGHDIIKDGLWPRYSSVGSTLKQAIKTGKVELLTNHIVEYISLDSSQKLANGLHVINIQTKEREKLDCKLIILCASTIQSLKILLNSSENIRSKGLIDPSGKLGSYLMDHISTCRFFSIKNDQEQEKTKLHKLTGAGSFFIPFGKNLDTNIKVDFLRGYGIWGGIDRFEPPDFIKTKTKTKTGFLIGHGEVLPYEENKVSLSKQLDKWEIPIPNIDFRWKDNELRMVNHMNISIENCIKASGGEVEPIHDLIRIPFLKEISQKALALQDSPPPPGYYVHEVGGAPMGTRQENSVLDKWNRLWQCKNILVVDGSCWPTSSWQSPTLTMMAITRRACIESIKNQS
ncbi:MULTISPECIES: GMC oxidoreductase [Prochlorococcus]|uniref:GMC family oxidoreductase n=1 Tax=Prochlorococcus marinus (strain SARG / CCMP1375 / SS120) TaxID=167539 RepID=Q7VCD2_PROMA|nr:MULTISPECIES: GMC family oxidoreductase [Prochlorococcus]AAP99852.1 GMC family oxidoreductase [Prochlorococcus marinus subsp. marinus str. CCMP1375]KGG11801.1 Glucose-methanol-choline (GMC) oxidoreductase:NAD binding site [Prochlorococcus marinus str. LG]KGG18785.1 Glucose-methanol-choline (GMC) oxidoreductase:NAD binding site [Prochlorococcus marinus str. SS2]KGG23677.1 Glucose-methanol-choline (GMC) oxidoreductase:NAD binding site [Prochlorococcus marinus str. SS35]KGG32087.1 Glucose-meth